METKDIDKKYLEVFDKWWDENEKNYFQESLHMSDYHMALSIWTIAINYMLENKQHIE